MLAILALHWAVIGAQPGYIYTFVGNRVLGDGVAATNALFHGPVGMAMSSTGDLHITDQFNCVIRKVVIMLILANLFVISLRVHVS